MGQSVWSPVSRVNLKNYTHVTNTQSTGKKVESDMKETKALFGSIMMISKLNRDIDQRQVIATYEFTATPRSQFDKSCLIRLL